MSFAWTREPTAMRYAATGSAPVSPERNATSIVKAHRATSTAKGMITVPVSAPTATATAATDPPASSTACPVPVTSIVKATTNNATVSVQTAPAVADRTAPAISRVSTQIAALSAAQAHLVSWNARRVIPALKDACSHRARPGRPRSVRTAFTRFAARPVLDSHFSSIALNREYVR